MKNNIVEKIKKNLSWQENELTSYFLSDTDANLTFKCLFSELLSVCGTRGTVLSIKNRKQGGHPCK